MKKWIAPFLILAFAVLLIACGKGITEKILEKNAGKNGLVPSVYMSAATQPRIVFTIDFQKPTNHKAG